MAKQSEQKKVPVTYQYDAIIIGTGPGGEGTAMNLSKNDKKVAVIERQESVGGGCVHWGTIPSKALRPLLVVILNTKLTHCLMLANALVV